MQGHLLGTHRAQDAMPVVADLPEPGSCRKSDRGCRDCQEGSRFSSRGSARRRLGELPTLAEILARGGVRGDAPKRRCGGVGQGGWCWRLRAESAPYSTSLASAGSARSPHVRGDPASRGSPCQARTWCGLQWLRRVLRQRAVSARHRRERPDHRFLQRLALARRRSALSMRARDAAGRASAAADALGRPAAAKRRTAQHRCRKRMRLRHADRVSLTAPSSGRPARR